MKPYVIAPAQLYKSQIMPKNWEVFLTIIDICVSLFSTFTCLIGLAFCDRF